MKHICSFLLILFFSSQVLAMPRIESFRATKTSVLKGQSTTLSWFVSGASQVDLFKEESGARVFIGKFSSSANLRLKPSITTTYVLQVPRTTIKSDLWVGVLTSHDVEAVNSGSGWVRCAYETQRCILPSYETYEVLYGADFTSNFRVKVYSSQQNVGCGNFSFGGDPAAGLAKACYYRKIQSAKLPIPSIDLTKIPLGHPGSPNKLLIPQKEDPRPAPAGAFRTHCEYSHMNSDDPIVAPGRRGGGRHLHMFFGNTLTNFNSTPDSITTSGNSTCDGGILNATAYWMPVVVNTVNRVPMAPHSESRGRNSIWYYKSAGANPSSVVTLPRGLKMITGHPNSRWPQDAVSFSCKKPDGTTVDSDHMPRNCVKGDHLTIQVKFPRCWDGRNLDSADHRSHMAFDLNGSVCPPSHPRIVPEVALQIRYTVDSTNTSKWRIASDGYSTDLPGGYSMHADWMNGWQQRTLNTIIAEIINKSLDAGVNNLGNGQQLGSVLNDD